MTESLASYPWNQFKRFSILVGILTIFSLLIGFMYRSVFLAIAISLIMAYIFYPSIDWLQARLKFRRPMIVTCMVFLFFGLVISLVAVFLPLLYQEILDILKKAPAAIRYLQSHVEPLQQWFISRGYFHDEDVQSYVGGFSLSQELTKTSSNALKQLWSTTPMVLGGALNFALIPIFSWFFLSYGKIFTAFLLSLVPADIQPLARLNMSKMNKILWGVIKGQVVVALILSILYMAGFSLIGLQSGLAIGAVAGICRIVPYLDVIVGGLLSIIVIISQGGTYAMVLAVAIVIISVQAIDGMFVTPRIIGERAGIHPVIVIASVIAFGDWFGLLGVVIAVPVVAMISAGMQIALPYYRNSPFFQRS
ncbi:MAG: AI-2E family transporter [Oligoflexus sp.]